MGFWANAARLMENIKYLICHSLCSLRLSLVLPQLTSSIKVGCMANTIYCTLCEYALEDSDLKNGYCPECGEEIQAEEMVKQ